MVESTAKGLGLEVNIKFDIHVHLLLDYVHMSMKFIECISKTITNTSLTLNLSSWVPSSLSSSK